MLGISKEQIARYGDEMRIPHLRDSTPAWSMRGRIRNKLLAEMNDFHPGIIKGLNKYVDHADKLEKFCNKAFLAWFEEFLQIGQAGGWDPGRRLDLSREK